MHVLNRIVNAKENVVYVVVWGERARRLLNTTDRTLKSACSRTDPEGIGKILLLCERNNRAERTRREWCLYYENSDAEDIYATAEMLRCIARTDVAYDAAVEQFNRLVQELRLRPENLTVRKGKK